MKFIRYLNNLLIIYFYISRSVGGKNQADYFETAVDLTGRVEFHQCTSDIPLHAFGDGEGETGGEEKVGFIEFRQETGVCVR